MEKKAAGRGGGINLVSQGFEVYAALLQVANDGHQVFSHCAPTGQASTQPGNPPPVLSRGRASGRPARP